MVKGSEDLPFVAEPFQNEALREAAAYKFDCDFFFVFSIRTDRAIDFAHAAVADLFNELIRPHSMITGRSHSCCSIPPAIDGRLAQESTSRLLMRRKKGFDFRSKFRIGTAFAVEIRRTVVDVKCNCLIQQLLHSLPALGIHAGARPAIDRYSQARAVTHSRFTVAGEIPSTSEVSSMVRPPKKRSSTMRLCCSSNPASSQSARSSSSRSKSG